MAHKRHVIVGCSAAGLSALETIRSLAPEDEIRVVSREKTLPYSPAVLPYLVSGRMSEDNLWIKNKDYFSRMKVSLSLGKGVAKVVPDEKKIVYTNGDSEAFDTLLIGVGADPTKLPISGLADAIIHFHTLGDFQRLAQLLGKDKGKEILIYGGGLVAVELAMNLLERGNPVSIVVRSRILRGYFNEYVGSVIEDILRSKGARVYTRSEIKKGKKQRGKIEVALSDGKSLVSDILVNCVGVKPRTSLVNETQIRTNMGIVVGRRMETSVPGIYAAGDVAEAPGFFSGDPGVNPILPSAFGQGKVAGANMAGKTMEYEGWISLNILNLFGNVGCSIGLAMPSNGGHEVLEEKSDTGKRFKRLVFKGDRLQGAMFLNVDADPGAILYLIEKKVDLRSHKEVLLERTSEMSLWLVGRAEREKKVL
jgi:phenylglyoxylate dehydrogenase epsilon subunit